jgi:hypothetical protein
MKVKKQTAMLVSFTLGALLLATTALADITTKSGYDQLKDALKVTAEQTSDKFDSFTLDLSIALKDNGKTMATTNDVHKYDRRKSASENTSSRELSDGEKSHSQTYSDKTTVIRVSDSDPTYYVTEFTQERKEEAFSDPFKKEGADDIEKIADAIVGSLKDHVVVTENTDGSKGVTGSLTEVQIPSLVNAVASFQMKQEFTGGRDNLPHLTKDVFVKEVKGTAKINKDGVIENVLGSAVLSGKDDQGMVHEISIEVLFKMSDINSTTVSKPDLAGKKVVKDIAQEYGTEISNPEKFVGKFKNDILIERDGKFVKIGERIIVIAHFDNKTAEGRYYEKYKPEFEEYANTKRDFRFAAQKSEEKNSQDFNFTTESGNPGNIYFDQYGGKIQFNLNSSSTGGVAYDSEFSPDLE